MKQLTTISLLISFLTTSCSKNFNGKLPDEDKTEQTRERLLRHDIIAERTPIIQKFDIGQVEPGDNVIVTLKGKTITTTFSDVYIRRVSSAWEKEECIYDPPDRPDRNKINKGRECYDVTRHGSCDVLFRDYLGEKEAPLLFPKSTDKIRLKYKIGVKNYNLGEMISYSENKIVAHFQVKEEMLDDDNNAELIVESDKESRPVRVGFQGLGNCDGKGQPGFGFNASSESTEQTQEERHEFYADIAIER